MESLLRFIRMCFGSVLSQACNVGLCSGFGNHCVGIENLSNLELILDIAGALDGAPDLISDVADSCQGRDVETCQLGRNVPDLGAFAASDVLQCSSDISWQKANCCFHLPALGLKE